MVDATMVGGAISSLKTLYEIANGMLTASKDAGRLALAQLTQRTLDIVGLGLRLGILS